MTSAAGGRSTRPLDIGVYGARAVPSTYSGFETFLTTLLPELTARGHRVTMYCRRGEDGSDSTPYEGVERVVLPAVPGKQFSTLSHGALAAVVSRRRGHDVVLVVNPANSLFCWFNRVTGQPVVLNVDGQEWLRGKWGRVARSVFHFASRISGRSANALVADCRGMADVFAREFGAVSSVVPYCSPAFSWEPDPTVLTAHDLRHRDYLVTGGRLNPENNIDGIARAFAATDLPTTLLVLGAANYDSPVQHELDRLAAGDPRIRLLGHVGDRSAFLTILNGATAYLHGHSVGGMNPSLVEAMRAGALVVALDTVFNREVLADAGLYFPGGIGRVGALAPVLDEVVGFDAEASDTYRSRAVDRAAHEFATADVVEAYEQVAEAAARSGRRTGVQVETRWAS